MSVVDPPAPSGVDTIQVTCNEEEVRRDDEKLLSQNSAIILKPYRRHIRAVMCIVAGSFMAAVLLDHPARDLLRLAGNFAQQLPHLCSCRYELLRGGFEPFLWSPTTRVVHRSGIGYRLFEIEAPTCRVRRFHGAERRQALDCLKGRHIVFIGDSVTRYQYLNLARWVETGMWSGPSPWAEVEKDFSSWPDFYQSTNHMLRGHELCDCFRISDRYVDYNTIENRYYHNPELGIRVTYMQLFRHKEGIKGHNISWLEGYRKSGQNAEVVRETGCAPGDCSPGRVPVHWGGDLLEVLEGYVTHELRPTDLIVNSGLWGQPLDTLNMTRLRNAGMQAVKGSGRGKKGHAYFKTTTATRDGGGKDERNIAAELENGGWRVLEAGRYTHLLPAMTLREATIQGWDPTNNRTFDQFYWDRVHQLPQVYAGVNQVLLEMLCPAGDSCPGRWKVDTGDVEVRPTRSNSSRTVGFDSAIGHSGRPNRTKVFHEPEDYWTASTSVEVPWQKRMRPWQKLLDHPSGVRS